MKNLTLKSNSPLGFSLVELMVSLSLGVLLVLGITEVATHNSLARNEMERNGRQIESASYAMGLLEKEIMSAGYWGVRGAALSDEMAPICPITIEDLEQAMAYPIQGGSGDFSCSMVYGNSILKPKEKSDFLALRRASSCDSASVDCGNIDDHFHIQVDSCTSAGDVNELSHNVAIDSELKNLIFLRRNCKDVAPQNRYLSRVFYLDSNDKLVRVELIGKRYQKIDLVENVELLRFEYGLDWDADGQVDSYKQQITDVLDPAWGAVILVRINLVVRNHQSSPGLNDKRSFKVAGEDYVPAEKWRDFGRQLYQRSVALRNRIGRRQ